MPDRPDVDRLLDILEALADASFTTFEADPVLQRAVLHALQTIGEAANYLSPETLAHMPTIRWPQLRGMRNRIVHGYFGLDLRAVWRTATEETAALASAIRASGLTGT